MVKGGKKRIINTSLALWDKEKKTEDYCRSILSQWWWRLSVDNSFNVSRLKTVTVSPFNLLLAGRDRFAVFMLAVTVGPAGRLAVDGVLYANKNRKVIIWIWSVKLSTLHNIQWAQYSLNPFVRYYSSSKW